MTALELEKLGKLLDKHYSLHETDALCRWITDENAPMSDFNALLDAINNDDVDFICDYNN